MAKIAVGDSDALIALVSEGDINHKKAVLVAQKLAVLNIKIIFPNTVIIETVTTLIRAKGLPKIAYLLNKQYKTDTLSIHYIDEEIQKQASNLLEATKSKKNTFFDAIVATTAKKLGTNIIFSFDNWYPKLGFKLASVI